MTIFLIALALITALSFTKFEISSVIEINQPPETVWAAIINFEQYDKWNTQLEFLDGDVRPEGTLHLKLTAEGADPYEFKPVISHWEENKKFAWLARTGLPRVFDGEHFFELTDIGNGKTQLLNREEYRGVMSQIIRRLPMMKNAPAGFEKMNAELKVFLETSN